MTNHHAARTAIISNNVTSHFLLTYYETTNGRAVSQITVAMSVSTGARPSLFGVNFQPV